MMLTATFGLLELHNQNIIHTDIHPSNIFLKNSYSNICVLGDLGFCLDKIENRIEKSLITGLNDHSD